MTTAIRAKRRVSHPMRTIFTQVTAVQRLAPHMNRITFTSPDFSDFVTDFADQFATLIFPLPHQERPPVTPGFTWEEFFAIPEEERPAARNYTIRHYRPEVNEIDIDIVLHGDTGFGTRWANHAKPGDVVAMWGPRVGYNPSPETTWQLLAGDITALPAVGAILDALPSGMRAQVVLEVSGPEDQLPLTSAAEFEVIWLHRPEGAPSRLLDTVADIPFPDGVNYGWGGGEMDLMSAYGRFLRRKRGLKTAAISAIGYWREEPH